MIDDKEHLQTVGDLIVSTTQQYKDGTIPQASYFKILVCLAYEYGTLGHAELCSRTLGMIAPDYFNATGPIHQQMTDDKDFCDVAILLAKWLVEIGIVSLPAKEPDLSSLGFLQKPGTA